MLILNICNKVIEYSFYALFFLVPLVLSAATSELFELNKMWLTWALTIVIGMAWFTKMIFQKRILLCRTPLDIPIVLFLISQIISTIFSLDSHVSLWGYYSRFNGGLLSMISYIFLYYAFVSNFVSRERHEKNVREFRENISDFGEIYAVQMAKRLLLISLISGLVVGLWGLPSHFGYDPTCFLFRGTLDVSCWTADFMPKIRIFSTLGQPDWLAAYLAILIPIAIAFLIQKRFSIFKNSYLILGLIALFYVDLLYTRARSGIIGAWLSLFFFAAAYFWLNGKPKLSFSTEKLKSPLAVLIFGFLIITFVIGTPIGQLHRFTLEGIGSVFQKAKVQKNPPLPTQPHESGGTESADIRLNVWKGAINAWRANPIIGSGVETFAFAYYKYKPAEHNLTSEWNFLYNKAHNEYLNYLATTGLFGLGSYLAMIGTFLFMAIKKLLFSENSEHSENQKFRQSDNLNIRKSGTPSFPSILNVGLLSGYVSTLVTNFFGFSVVITNIYLFMIPAFVFALAKFDLVLEEKINPQTAQTNKAQKIDSAFSVWQWTPIFFVSIIGIYMLITLFRFWRADIAYALGKNLDLAGEYQQAYPHLQKAVELRGSELVFKDELSINNAIIAAGLIASEPTDAQKEQTISVAASLVQEAINTSNEIISKSPNNAVFWKTRVRLFFTLSQIDSRYLPKALEGIEKASLLAPNDANIWYNLGVLYGQNDNIKKGIEALEKTIQLRPSYRDARYALGLYYRTESLDETGKVVIDSALNQKAIAQMQYILDNIVPNDTQAQESIKNWGE